MAYEEGCVRRRKHRKRREYTNINRLHSEARKVTTSDQDIDEYSHWGRHWIEEPYPDNDGNTMFRRWLE